MTSVSKLRGIDCVVVNYQSPMDLDKFLSSYTDGGPWCPSTLYIVNVCPGRADTEVANAYRSKGLFDVVVIHSEENIGYSGACNLAASMGTREIIAFFNADTELDWGIVDRCRKEILSDDAIGVLGPRQVNREGRITHAGIFGTESAPAHRGWLELGGNKYLDTKDAITVSGAAYFVRRRMWEELTSCPLYQEVAPDATGAFLPTSHFYEETWCSYHARAHGWRVVYFGGITMIHNWTPPGAWANRQMPISQKYFREACAHHGIDCD